jgi:uncharacterized protein DUF5671
MQTARRLYLYAMSGVTLGVLLTGLSSLLTVALHAAGIGRGEFVGGSADDRQQLSLAIALIVVGLLVWTIHWLLVERSLRPANPAHDAERASSVRALYLTVVLTVLLALGVVAGIGILETVVRRLMGSVDTDGFAFAGDLGSSLATLIVTGMAWAYHASIRRRDLGGAALTGAAAWIPRVYLYGATLLGLVLMSVNIGTLLGHVLSAVVGEAPSLTEGDFRLRATADAVAGIIGWGIVFLGHWWYANGLVHDPGWRGVSERPARLRLAYYAAAIGASAIAIVVFTTQSLSAVIGLVLGREDPVTNQGAMLAIGAPALSLLPWVVSWWLHLRWMRAESLSAEDAERIATADRLDAAIVSLIGLAAAAIGIGGLLGLLLDSWLGGNRTEFGFWRNELSGYLALAVIGAVLWLWHWLRLQRRRASGPSAEAGSTIRRAYLLLVVAASLIGSLGTVAYLLYRLVGAILQVQIFDDAVSAIATPLGALVVAAALAIYHGLVLRGDQALREEAAETSPVEAEPPSPEQRVLVLSGPAGTDLEATVAAMRAALGPELRLEERTPEG